MRELDAASLPLPPTLQQAGEAEDVLGRILEARTPLGALLGPADVSARPPETGERLARYRRVVNQVHPDRCVDRRAVEAFERVSRAYETLSTAAAVAESAVTSSAAAAVVGVQQLEPWFGAKATVPRSDAAGCRWWHVGNVGELDRMLAYCASAARALRAHLEARPGGEEALSRAQLCVAGARRACEHLDRSRGLPRSRLWFATSTQPFGEASDSASNSGGAGRAGGGAAEAVACSWRRRVQADAQMALLVDLLAHLRSVHHFCPLSGRRCSHAAELDVASPQAAVEDLLSRWLAQAMLQKDALAMAAPVAMTDGTGDGAVEEEDPLDAYMASLEAELRGERLADGVDGNASGDAVGYQGGNVATSVDTAAAVDGVGEAGGNARRSVPKAPPQIDEATRRALSQPSLQASKVLPSDDGGHAAAAVPLEGALDSHVKRARVSAVSAFEAFHTAPVPPRMLLPKPAFVPDASGVRLATGGLVELSATSATGDAVAVRSLQDNLFANQDSGDESELEDKRT